MIGNIKEDLSKLTTIDTLYIGRLFEKINWCISDYVEEASLKGDNLVEVDFGFGKLFICIGEDSVKYSFKPSKELDESVINTIVDGRNSLTLNLEKNLSSKITNIYKDMF